MKTILNIIVCMTLLAGCEKEEPETTISGVVVNYGTLKPIDSVLVTVISGAGKGTFGDTKGSGNEVSVYTDKDGKFTINIKGDNLFLYLRKDKYWYDEEIFGAYKSYTAGTTNTNELFKLKAISYFEGLFYCKDCLATDSVYLIDGFYINNGVVTGGMGNELHIGNGPFDYGFRRRIREGDCYFEFGIKSQKKGIWQPLIIDSVYIKSFETFTDTIYY